MGDASQRGGVARRVPLPDGTYTRPDVRRDDPSPEPPDVVAKVVEPKPVKRPKSNTDVRTKSVGGAK